MDFDEFLPDDYVEEPVNPSAGAVKTVRDDGSVDDVGPALLPDPAIASSVSVTEAELPLVWDIDKTVDRTQTVSKGAQRLAAQRDTLIKAEERHALQVREAKGRESYEDEVEAILKELQQEAHERSVGAFQRMLSSIAKDVNPTSNIEVQLTLGTERKMPALDIAASQKGEPEAVTSGELANILSTGLRFITLARSDRRPFIVLDEADCYMGEKSVPNFFNVIHQLSKEVGIQTLIITHHDLSEFADFRIYEVRDVASPDRWPNRVVDMANHGDMQMSEMQDDCLSWIHLTNFEAYVDATIQLSPGVTAITGPNRHGKSAWARAIRASFGEKVGDSSDLSIRHDTASFSVQVGFSDGRVFEHSRRRKGEPKGEFILHSEESFANAQTDPKWAKNPEAPKPLFHTKQAALPDWVTSQSKIGRVDDIDIQLWPQLTPLFMLNEPNTKKAAMLAVGRESGYLMAMSQTFKTDVRLNKETISRGEAEIYALREQLKTLDGVDQLLSETERLSDTLRELVSEQRWVDESLGILSSLEKCKSDMAHASEWRSLNAAPLLDPVIERTEGLVTWLERATAAKELIALKTDVEILEVPAVLETSDLMQLSHDMGKARQDMLLKGKMPEEVVEPTVLATQDLTRLMSDLSTSANAAALLGQLPTPVKLPAVEETSALAQLATDVAKADLDRKTPVIENLTAPTILATTRLKEWLHDVEEANVHRQLPRLETIEAIAVIETSPLSVLLTELSSNHGLAARLEERTAALRIELACEQEVAEELVNRLGYDAFALPSDLAEQMAEEAVEAFQAGSKDKVVASLQKIEDKIQQGARHGFLKGTESVLNLPDNLITGSLLPPANESADAPVEARARPRM